MFVLPVLLFFSVGGRGVLHDRDYMLHVSFCGVYLRISLF